MQFTPYSSRMSGLATTRGECVQMLRDLIASLNDRMAICRERGARNIWDLAERQRPIPVVVLVDEVAELFLMATRGEKEEISETATLLLRIAQLGRALGLHLVVAGQRIGSDLGPGVTALRSQLSGRVCHRVNDPETASMTLGDLDDAALVAARAILADTPGVAVVSDNGGGWHLARSATAAPPGRCSCCAPGRCCPWRRTWPKPKPPPGARWWPEPPPSPSSSPSPWSNAAPATTTRQSPHRHLPLPLWCLPTRRSRGRG
jgi:FtsK/SpoIIIE family